MPIDVFDMSASISVDNNAFQNDMGISAGIAGGFASQLASIMTGVVKSIGNAIKTAMQDVTQFVGDSVQTGMTFEASMSQVAATLGLSNEELAGQIGEADTAFGHFSGNLSDFARFMGRNTKFTASQAAEALNYMALAGYNVDESLQMMPNVLALASAGNYDLGTASDQLTDIQSALGLSFERTTQLTNEMARAASTGNTNVEQLGEAFLRIGGLARELNGGYITLDDGTQVAVDGTQELATAFVALANSGIKGSEAGTHMRNVIMKLLHPTSQGAHWFEDLGVSVYDTEGKMRGLNDIISDLSDALFAEDVSQETRIAAISELFNARDLASAEALLAAISGDWDEIGAAIYTAGDAAQEMAATQLDNLAGDITIFKSAVEGAQIAISEELAPTLRDFVEWGTSAIQNLTAAWETGGAFSLESGLGARLKEIRVWTKTELPDLIDDALGIFDTVISWADDHADELLQTGFDIVMTILEGIGKAASGETVGNGKSNRAIDQSIRRGVLAGPEEADFSRYESFEDADKEGEQEITGGLFKNILSGLMNIITQIEQFFNDPDNKDRIREALLNLLEQGVEAAFDQLPARVEMRIQQKLREMLGIDRLGLIIDIYNTVSQLLDYISANVPEWADQIAENMPQIVERVIDELIEHIPEYVEASFRLLVSFIKAIPRVLLAIAKVLTSFVMSIIGYFTDPDKQDKMGEAGEDLINAFWTGLQDIWDAIKEGVEYFINGLIDMFFDFGLAEEKDVAWAVTIQDAVDSLCENVTEKLTGLISSAWQWGKDLISNFANGILSMLFGGDGTLEHAVNKGVGVVKSRMGFSEPEEGPLSDFHTYAPDMMKLFARGILDNASVVSDAVESAFDLRPIIDDGAALETLSGDSTASGGTAASGAIFNVTINMDASKVQNPRQFAEQMAEELQAITAERGLVWA